MTGFRRNGHLILGSRTRNSVGSKVGLLGVVECLAVAWSHEFEVKLINQAVCIVFYEQCSAVEKGSKEQAVDRFN